MGMKVSWAVPVIVSIFILSFIMINPVYADVDGYLILKLQGFEQTANDAQPTFPSDELDFIAEILTTALNDFTAVSLTGATVTPVALTEDAFEWFFLDEYGTKAALDLAYPNGNPYTLDGTGGNLGPLSEPITFGTENYPTVVPFFTGNTYNDLQGVNSDPPINLTFNMASLGGAQVNFVGLIVEDASANGVYFQELTVSSTSATIPAGTLLPNTDYTVFLEWSADTVDAPVTSFSPGVGASGFALETYIEFKTSPPMFIVVGGTSIPIDTTALLLAGVQSISMWMIPILAGIGIGVFVIIRRK